MFATYKRGGPPASYRWAGWILRNHRFKFTTLGKSRIVLKESIYKSIPYISEGNAKAFNYMGPAVGLGNTWISTDFAQNVPGHLLCIYIHQIPKSPERVNCTIIDLSNSIQVPVYQVQFYASDSCGLWFQLDSIFFSQLFFSSHAITVWNNEFQVICLDCRRTLHQYS